MPARPVSAAIAALASVLAASTVPAQPPRQVVGHIARPRVVEPTARHLRALQLPEGFTIRAFAEGLENARMLAVGDDGAVYVTRREQGDVLRLRDEDGDGKADEVRTMLRLPDVHGITIHNGDVYLATVREVYRVPVGADGSFGRPVALMTDLPDGGQHPNRTLAFGPDGKLYVSVGSTCNACVESNPESATLLRAEPDGTSRIVFASGLRNTIGFAWHPRTGDLWGLDHGSDWLGDDRPREELNRLIQGANYGWPFVTSGGQIDESVQPPMGFSVEEFQRRSTPPTLTYTAHAAPMQLVFYTGDQFPSQYRGDAFATMRGSWNRQPPSGYEIVRIRFRNGEPQRIDPFVSGFLVEEGTACIARPVGLAVARDGSLLMSDDTNGVIYRIAYAAERR